MRQTRTTLALSALLISLGTLAACGDDAPDPPISDASTWLLDTLAGNGPRLDAREVQRHFSPAFLADVMPPEAVVEAIETTIDEHGALRFVRYDFPPHDRSLVAIVEGDDLLGAVHLGVDSDGAITDLEIQEAPPERPVEDGDTGWFTTSGEREVYLHCTGDGPAVILDGGVWSDWEAVRAELAGERVTVCAFDRPGTLGSASTPVPTPRTARAHVADLRDALAEAGIGGPYVVAGHSNSALFDQLWAVDDPADIAGLVLVDPVTHDYHERRFAALADRLPPEQLEALRADSEPKPVLFDAEQLDIAGTQRLLAEAWGAALDLPAVVLTHGVPAEAPPGWPVDVDEALWRDLHRDLAARFHGGRLVVAEQSGHDIHRMQPDLVADAIRDVVRGSAARVPR